MIESQQHVQEIHILKSLSDQEQIAYNQGKSFFPKILKNDVHHLN